MTGYSDINMPGLNCFSPLKAKLDAGLDGALLTMGDSTWYLNESTDLTGEQTSAMYWLAQAVGARYPKIKVVNHLWGGWDPVLGTDTNPSEYLPARVMYNGGGPQTLHMWSAVLPGSVPCYMFTNFRRTNAFRTIGNIDLALIHHGHNAQGTGFTENGRGIYISAVMNLNDHFPNVPVGIIRQNPWRDATTVDKVHNDTGWAKTAADAIGATAINAWQPFIDVAKSSIYYQAGGNGNIHPNSLGHQTLTIPAVMAVFDAARPGRFITRSPLQTKGQRLEVNGDFTAFPTSPGDPTGWTHTLSTISKELVIKEPGFAWSVKIVPTADTCFFTQTPSQGVIDTYKGQEVTVSARVFLPNSKKTGVLFVVNNGGNAPNQEGLQTALGEWIWIVFSGLAIPGGQTTTNLTWNMLANFGAVADDRGPMYLQRVVVNYGRKPALA